MNKPCCCNPQRLRVRVTSNSLNWDMQAAPQAHPPRALPPHRLRQTARSQEQATKIASETTMQGGAAGSSEPWQRQVCGANRSSSNIQQQQHTTALWQDGKESQQGSSQLRPSVLHEHGHEHGNGQRKDTSGIHERKRQHAKPMGAAAAPPPTNAASASNSTTHGHDGHQHDATNSSRSLRRCSALSSRTLARHASIHESLHRQAGDDGNQWDSWQAGDDGNPWDSYSRTLMTHRRLEKQWWLLMACPSRMVHTNRLHGMDAVVPSIGMFFQDGSGKFEGWIDALLQWSLVLGLWWWHHGPSSPLKAASVCLPACLPACLQRKRWSRARLRREKLRHAIRVLSSWLRHLRWFNHSYCTSLLGGKTSGLKETTQVKKCFQWGDGPVSSSCWEKSKIETTIPAMWAMKIEGDRNLDGAPTTMLTSSILFLGQQKGKAGIKPSIGFALGYVLRKNEGRPQSTHQTAWLSVNSPALILSKNSGVSLAKIG